MSFNGKGQRDSKEQTLASVLGKAQDNPRSRPKTISMERTKEIPGGSTQESVHGTAQRDSRGRPKRASMGHLKKIPRVGPSELPWKGQCDSMESTQENVHGKQPTAAHTIVALHRGKECVWNRPGNKIQQRTYDITRHHFAQQFVEYSTMQRTT